MSELKDYRADTFALKFNLNTKNTPVGGQLGGLFSREPTFWFLHRRSVPNAAVKKAWRGPRYVRSAPLQATLPSTWSAKGRQDFGTIANDDASSTGVCEIHRNVSTGACRRRKNDTFDTF